MKRPVLLLAALMLLAVTSAADDLPQFPDIGMTSLAGKTMPLHELLGRATIVNFWATWCGPCRVELPELESMRNEHGEDGLAVLIVAIDSPRALVGRFLERLQVGLPNYFVDPEVERGLGIRQVPTTILLDAQARIVQIYAGYSKAGMQDLSLRVERLLAQGEGDEGGS